MGTDALASHCNQSIHSRERRSGAVCQFKGTRRLYLTGTLSQRYTDQETEGHSNSTSVALVASSGSRADPGRSTFRFRLTGESATTSSTSPTEPLLRYFYPTTAVSIISVALRLRTQSVSNPSQS